MNNSYDFYNEFAVENVRDIYELTRGSNNYGEIKDIYNRIELLITSVIGNDLKTYAQVGALSRELRRTFKEFENKAGLKRLVHDCGLYDTYINFQLQIMRNLELVPQKPDLDKLPKGYFFIQIEFTLKKPFVACDDVPLYVIENPVRKDKVFKVPVMSSTSWKGNLRWTMTRIFLESEADGISDREFACRRLRLSLLFGAEKGFEDDKTWSNYLENLKPGAGGIYKEMLEKYFRGSGGGSHLHFKGRLNFYPAFFDKMDLMVTNPHDRETKTGRNPVYIESVPKGATGIFTLLYMPFDMIGRKNITKDTIARETKEDLRMTSKGIREMLFTYGFSAKKSSGFGVVEPIERERISLFPDDSDLREVVLNNLAGRGNNEWFSS